jgi:protein involved in polysaccharide export with SLBB domain
MHRMISWNKFGKRTLSWVGAAALGLLLAGCATTQPDGGDHHGATNSTEVEPATPGSLGIGELVTITYADTAQPLSPFEGRIREDGKITLMHNQEFQAAGKTVAELEKDIVKRYVPSYYVNLTATVKAQDRFFYVEGEVRMPARLDYRGNITILGAISAANGFTEFANKKKVKIIRANNKSFAVNCVKAQDDPKQDVPIYPGDRIVVPKKIW